ncbi:C40 family peptidase [Dactylosporangium roseum]|uniref:C40 family peptidase n=1 Tax=Dactylosporangium roseum TaxID=47989 RepID=A0ABY5Z6P9_9ACTN|nr:C40 family peptidase [Dactylosporangium roseum]UWZ37715.1 C40 family peptidase [Dactylosporangium roseum]
MSTGHRARRSVLRTLLIGAVSLIVLAPATVARADPTLAEIEAQLQKSGEELEATVEAWNQMNVALADSQAKVADLQTKLKPMEDAVAASAESVQSAAVHAFKTSGNLRNLSVVLNAGSSDTLMDQLSMLNEITRQQQKHIDEFRTAKTALEEQKKGYDQTIAAQNAQKAEIEAKRKKIESEMAQLDKLKQKVNKPATPKGPPPAVSGKAGIAVRFAFDQIGDPYVFGKAGPNAYDCSGLTMAAWNAAGVSLPHSAAQQWSKVAHISRGDLQPGDLVFYNNLGHVAIYEGNGKVIHAPTSGRTVTEASVDMGNKIYGYGRVRA